MISGAVKDRQRSTATGSIVEGLPHDARILETRNRVTANGITSEVFRSEWSLMARAVDHIIHVELRPNAVSAWHMHEARSDCIFVLEGTIRLVMYDARDGSPTCNRLCVLNLSRMQPAIVTIPAGVWHGFKNLESAGSSMLNFADSAYRYDNPDEWRLPWDTAEIPYRF
jgi:dTDP-4-dehydrorhamnose 3,5-epimerase